MPLKLVPLVEGMAEEVIQVYLAAFGPEPANSAMLPKKTPALIQALIERERNSVRNQKPDAFAFAVVDTDLPPRSAAPADGRIVGFSKWQVETAGAHEDHAVDGVPKPDSNPEARRAFFGLIDGLRRETMEDQGYLHLILLATDPEHSRRGAARMCLEWGLAKANELGLTTYLDSTPTGRPVYERLGFRPVKTKELDLRPFGVESTYVTASMIKETSKQLS